MAVATAKADPADRGAAPLAEEELFRAGIYGLLARLLAAPPSAEFLAELGALHGDATELGAAFAALAAAARATAPARVAEEYHDLFIGLARGELLPFGSYYLTGFLNEKPLATLRGSLARLGIARADHVKEPEDHIAALCEVMAGLIAGSFGACQPLSEQRAFFEQHLAAWAGRFFVDLAEAQSAGFYAAVGRLGRLYFEIETTAFAMSD
jgi:TorA maturation chaperone TorD